MSSRMLTAVLVSSLTVPGAAFAQEGLPIEVDGVALGEPDGWEEGRWGVLIHHDR
ncbi:MAG TPA: hypothetical protein VLA09_05370 [Longimicrobiales bacterium]|nr:hypothetical protein [Longimicrobiales bacterium]